MKLISTTAAILLLASVAAGSPSVEVLRVVPSSQNARITVLHDGKPVQNVKVDVFNTDEKLRVSLATDADGVVVIPTLPRGKYHIGATAPGHLGADLILEVSNKRKTNKSSFSMQLSEQPPTFEEKIADAERNAPRELLQEFKGIAVDPSGMGIPKLKIQIFQRGAGGKGPIAATDTDAAGRFSAHLSKGSYTAIFQMSGFRTKIHVFEIAVDGEQKELRIRVDLAPST